MFWELEVGAIRISCATVLQLQFSSYSYEFRGVIDHFIRFFSPEWTLYLLDFTPEDYLYPFFSYWNRFQWYSNVRGYISIVWSFRDRLDWRFECNGNVFCPFSFVSRHFVGVRSQSRLSVTHWHALETTNSICSKNSRTREILFESKGFGSVCSFARLHWTRLEREFHRSVYLSFLRFITGSRCLVNIYPETQRIIDKRWIGGSGCKALEPHLLSIRK